MRLVVTPGFLIALALAMPAQALTLVKAGKATATVVSAPGATPAEQKAGIEVAEHVRRISGSGLAIVLESQAPDSLQLELHGPLVDLSEPGFHRSCAEAVRSGGGGRGRERNLLVPRAACAPAIGSGEPGGPYAADI